MITALAAGKNNDDCCESQSPSPLRNSFCFANLCALLSSISNLGWFPGEQFPFVSTFWWLFLQRLFSWQSTSKADHLLHPLFPPPSPPLDPKSHWLSSNWPHFCPHQVFCCFQDFLPPGRESWCSFPRRWTWPSLFSGPSWLAWPFQLQPSSGIKWHVIPRWNLVTDSLWSLSKLFQMVTLAAVKLWPTIPS